MKLIRAKDRFVFTLASALAEVKPFLLLSGLDLSFAKQSVVNGIGPPTHPKKSRPAPSREPGDAMILMLENNDIPSLNRNPFENAGTIEERLARLEVKIGSFGGAIARLTMRVEQVLEEEGKLRKAKFNWHENR